MVGGIEFGIGTEHPKGTSLLCRRYNRAVPQLDFVTVESCREDISAAFEKHVSIIGVLVPGGSAIEMGSTSVAGALTKGDLDILVSIESQLFDAAVEALKTRYSVHQPENWHATYASFVDPNERAPEVGVQLAVAGSSVDKAMRRFPELLRRDPILRDRYNALKQAFEGGDPVEYATAKGAFIEDCLRGADDERPRLG